MLLCQLFFITDLIKPSSSLPTDILANGDMKTDTDSSENTTAYITGGEEVQIKHNSENSPTSSKNVCKHVKLSKFG